MARLERKPAERVATAGLIIQILAGALAVLFWDKTHAATIWVFAWQALIGLLIWIMALVHLRQSRLAEEEQEDWDRLQAERAAGGARGQLFEQDEILAFAARNRLRIFEKYIAPSSSLLIVILLALTVALGFASGIIPQSKTVEDKAVQVYIGATAGIAFVLFLIAMYASGMSRQEAWRPLRAGASYMMFCAISAGAAALVMGLGYFQYAKPDHIVAYALLAILGIVVIEMLLNFVLDFYRPRVEGVESRAAYDSRLLGLLSQPGGIFKTVSATLDYQFGFTVSQTWFYRFVEQAIAPLILFDILTLYLLTCFVIVGPEQQGIVERFGRFRGEANGVLSPGLHMKWPWPLERVYRFSANEVKTIQLGHSGEEEKKTGAILWNQAHYAEEYSVMLAAQNTGTAESKKGVPVNLLVATTTVRYRIADVAKWYYGVAEPESLLEAICEREQIKYMAGVDLSEVMGPGRSAAGKELCVRMQAASDAANLGVTILGVGVEDMHPPVAENLPDVFLAKVDAMTNREVDILLAEQKALDTIYTAKQLAAEDKSKARYDYTARVNAAAAEADRFRVQEKAFRSSPEVFKAREFLSALEKGLENTRKVIVGVQGLDREQVRLDLSEVIGPDLSGIPEFGSTPDTDQNAKKQ